MSDVMLSREEVYEMTKYRRPSKQIAWLKRNGVRFMVAADGYPTVLRREVVNQAPVPMRQPNLEALRRLS